MTGYKKQPKKVTVWGRVAPKVSEDAYNQASADCLSLSDAISYLLIAYANQKIKIDVKVTTSSR